MKRILWIVLPLILASLTLVAVGNWLKPKIGFYLLGQLREFTQKQARIDLGPTTLDVSYLPPSISLKNISLQFSDPQFAGIQNLSADSLNIHLDFLQLLGGRISLSILQIKKPELVLNIDKWPESQDPLKQIDLSPLFQALDLVPIKRVLLSNARIAIEIPSKKTKLSLDSTSLLLQHLDKQIRLSTETENGLLTVADYATPVAMRLSSGFSTSKLQVSEFILNLGELGKLKLSGETTDLLRLPSKTNLQAQADLNLSLSSLYPLLNNLFPNKISPLKGELNSQSQLQMSSASSWKASIDFEATDLNIDNTEIGKISAKTQASPKDLSVTSIQIEHPAGRLNIKKGQLQWDSPYSLSASMQTEKLDIQALLQSLELKNVPLDLAIAGEALCSGELSPLQINCKTSGLKSDYLEVRDSIQKDAFQILALENIVAAGDVQITSKEVSYSAEVRIHSSQGTSSGRIVYADGFDIQYSTDNLNLAHIKNLAGLKLEGQGKIKGDTKGDSRFGTIDMQIQSEKFWFEDFFIGNAATILKYRGGELIFEDLRGQLYSSPYSGNLSVNLVNDSIKGNIASNKLEIAEGLMALERKISLPVSITGSGRVLAQFEGPLDLSQLSYDLQLDSHRGNIATESYEHFRGQLSSEKGQVKIVDSFLKKYDSLVVFKGQAKPDGQIDVLVTGDRLRLDESEFVSNLSDSLIGLLDFRLSLKGHILRPDLYLKGNLSQMLLSDIDIPDSAFSMQLSRQGVEGITQLMGNRLRSEFKIPFNSTSPFLFKLTATDWDFASLLASASGSTLKAKYNSNLTAEVDLFSLSGGVDKAHGFIRVDKFFLERAPERLENRLPLVVEFNEGLVDIKNFELHGQNSFVKVTGKNFRPLSIESSVAGKLDLRLLQILTPFLDELGGLSQFSFQAKGPFYHPNVLGSASFDEAFVKIKGFPHPFEKATGQMDFSQTRLRILNLRGQLAGGSFYGDGTIDIKAYKNIPIAVRARVDNVSLNVPDKVNTKGSGDFTLTGTWFPYTLAGQYQVTSGLIEKDFTEDDKSLGSIRRSHYLPKTILASGFEPISLDLDLFIKQAVAIRNPLMEGSASGRLKINGTPNSPSLLGEIRILSNSQLQFRENQFEVTSGTIRFTDSGEINPELYVAGRSRVKEYDVSLLVQGRAKAPIVQLSSQPPLNEQDIISLLAIGITSSQETGRVATEQDLAAQVGIGAFSSLLGGRKKQIKESFGLEVDIVGTYDDTKATTVPKFTFSFPIGSRLKATGTVVNSDQGDFKLKYGINEYWNAVTSFERTPLQDLSSTSTGTGATKSIYGLDLEYKVEFK